jgi:hypothetical protein
MLGQPAGGLLAPPYEGQGHPARTPDDGIIFGFGDDAIYGGKGLQQGRARRAGRLGQQRLRQGHLLLRQG